MSLYVRLQCNFYTHRKTRRLQSKLGNDAIWLPPRLWAFAAENEPDGTFADYTAEELAVSLGYTGDAKAMLQALLQAGFMDADPLRIHNWAEHNGYHKVFAERARNAAKARWQKESSKEKDKTRGDKRQAMLQASNQVQESDSQATAPPPVEALARGGALARQEDWKLTADLERIQAQIHKLTSRDSTDKDLIAGLKAQLAPIKAEIRRRGKPSPKPTEATEPKLEPAKEGRRPDEVPREEWMQLCAQAKKAAEAPAS